MPLIDGRFARGIVCTAAALVGFSLTVGHAARVQQTAAAVRSPCQVTLHCASLSPDRFAWLSKLKAGDSSRDAVLSAEFRDLVASVTPGVAYHFHIDMPLASAFSAVIRGPAEPIALRDGRYMTISACQVATCSGARALLWVDTNALLAVGALEFSPSNGEPTPTQTLFSSQILDVITELSQLPDAFVADLHLWSRASRFRAPMARYFINGGGFETAVPHDEDNCVGGDRSSLPLSLCAAMNVEAADQDVQAAFYLLVKGYANGPARTQLQADQDKWRHDRQTACGMGVTLDALACQLKYTRDRVHALTDQYVKPLRPSDR